MTKLGHMRVILPTSIIIAWTVRWLGIPVGSIDALDFWCWPILSLQMEWGPWIWPLNALIWVGCGLAVCVAEVYKRARRRTTDVTAVQAGALLGALLLAALADRFGDYIGP